MKTVLKFTLLLLCSSVSLQSFATESGGYKSPSKSNVMDGEILLIALLLVVIILLLWYLHKVKSSIFDLEKENSDLEKDLDDLKERYRDLVSRNSYAATMINNLERDNAELEELRLHKDEDSLSIQTEEEQETLDKDTSQTEIIMEKPVEVKPQLPLRKMFANVDVENNRFVTVTEKLSRQSTYLIYPDEGSFELIEDKDLYDVCLSNLNSYGILDACEVEGIYSEKKTVTVTPGRVEKVDKDWVIVDKCKIKIES